jgi:hypothetical protein
MLITAPVVRVTVVENAVPLHFAQRLARKAVDDRPADVGVVIPEAARVVASEAVARVGAVDGVRLPEAGGDGRAVGLGAPVSAEVCEWNVRSV